MNRPDTSTCDYAADRGQHITVAVPVLPQPEGLRGPVLSYRVLPAGERIHKGDAVAIGQDGRAYLADRDEAARRARADVSPAAAGDVSRRSAGDGDDEADTAIIARAEP